MGNDLKIIDSAQPTPLVGAAVLSYISAVFAILSLFSNGFFFSLSNAEVIALELFTFFVPLGQGICALGFSNDKQVAYKFAIALAILQLALLIWLEIYAGFDIQILNLIFDIILVALLLHPSSRQYASTWFK